MIVGRPSAALAGLGQLREAAHTAELQQERGVAASVQKALEDLESAQVKVLAKVDVLEAKLDAVLGALAAGGQGGLGTHPVQGDGAVWAHKKI